MVALQSLQAASVWNFSALLSCRLVTAPSVTRPPRNLHQPARAVHPVPAWLTTARTPHQRDSSTHYINLDISRCWPGAEGRPQRAWYLVRGDPAGRSAALPYCCCCNNADYHNMASESEQCTQLNCDCQQQIVHCVQRAAQIRTSTHWNQAMCLCPDQSPYPKLESLTSYQQRSMFV